MDVAEFPLHRSTRAQVALVETAAAPVPPAPRPPGLLGLHRAAELVEGAAFDLADRESPVFVSRLIEIAAELDRLSKSRLDHEAGGATVRRLRD